MRILYVTAGMEWPLSHGGQIRRWNMLQGLLQAGETDVVACQDPGMRLYREAYAGCRQVWQVDDRPLRFSLRQKRLYDSTLGRGWLTLGTLRPYEFLGRLPVESIGPVLHEIDAGAYDLIWLSTARMAMALGSISGTPTILDGDDFEYVREAMVLQSSPWYGAKVWNYLNVAKLWWWERRWPRMFQAVVRCSEEDRKRLPAPNVHVIANGADVPETYERVPEPRLLFVGLLSYPPNADAVEWFLQNIWPLVRAKVPDAACDIVGSGPSPLIQEWHGREGVAVHGFVADLKPLYRRAAASIVPLRAGSGTRLKILESLAHAVPVVSTTLGAYGISASDEQGLLRGDSPNDFAGQCVRLLERSPLDQDRALAGRQLVMEQYAWSRIHEQVAELAARTASAAPRRLPQPQIAPQNA